jgi:hypothetical protein
MSHKYRAEQIVCISGFDCGTEIELKMVVSFKVHPGSKATEIDPPEQPSAEVIEVHFFEVKDGKPSSDERSMPVWLFNRLTEGDAFYNWLLSEASEQHQVAVEDAAEARREMMREELS